MRTVALYKKFAGECAQLAVKITDPKSKQTLQSMARTWERIAVDREEMLKRQIDRRTGIASLSTVAARLAERASDNLVSGA